MANSATAGYGPFSGRAVFVILMLAFEGILLAATPVIIEEATVPRLTIQSQIGATNQIQFKADLGQPGWATLADVVVGQTPYAFADATAPSQAERFYRIAASSLDAPEIFGISLVTRLTIESDLGITNQIQFTTDLELTPWTALTNVVVSQSPYAFVDLAVPANSGRYYRVRKYPPHNPPPPTSMVLVPAGVFQMGDQVDGLNDALPVHPIDINAFYLERHEVTKALWDEVYLWAITNGYNFTSDAQGKASNHPIHSVSWYDAIKWCNARSEMEGREPAYYTNPSQTYVYRTGQIAVQTNWVIWNAGYRLPTEAEWEKAARGGGSGWRFPWSDTNSIAHSRASYFSFWQVGQPFYPYDVSANSGYHPDYSSGVTPHTSPVGSFAANDLGVYDMAGNVWEWCWDWWAGNYYSVSPATNPLGPPAGSFRVLRGGSWASHASGCRVANRGNGSPDSKLNTVGFRCVLPKVEPVNQLGQ